MPTSGQRPYVVVDVDHQRVASPRTAPTAYVYFQAGTWNNTGTWTIDNSSGANADEIVDYTGTNLVHNTGTITKTGHQQREPSTSPSTTTAPSPPPPEPSTVTGALGYDAGTQTFSGGTWMASGGGTLRLDTVGTVATADATFIVDGAGSQIRDGSSVDVLAGLTSITSNGGLTLRNAVTRTLPGPLTTVGRVTIGATSGLTTSGLYKQTAGARASRPRRPR